MPATCVIFVPGTAGPSVYHDSLASARKEAKRLLDSGGANQVMICRYVEGLQKRTTVTIDPLGPNPLRKRGMVDVLF